MFFNSWLDSIRHRISRSVLGHRRRRSRQSIGSLEKLEDRTLLSVSALFSNGVLQIKSADDNGADMIVVGADASGNVQVMANGELVSSLGALPASQVERIVVKGNAGSNLINLSGVTTAVYSNPDLAIDVDGGNGHDTILGSFDGNDVIDGGHGNDLIYGEIGRASCRERV